MKTLAAFLLVFPFAASAQLVPLIGTPAPAPAPEPPPAASPPPQAAPAPRMAPSDPQFDGPAEWAPYSDRRAYRGGLMALSWLPAIPVGGMTSKIPNATVHGMELDVRMSVHKGFTLGIDGSWQNFWTRADRASYPFSTTVGSSGPTTGAVTAQVWRYLETFQVRGSFAYHFDVKRESHLVPYVKLGFGIAANRYEVDAADLVFNRYQTNFAFAADVGTLIDLKFSRAFGSGFIVAVRYGLTSANFTQPDLATPMSIGFILGGYFSF